jgi:hypothetical protein
MLAHVDHAWLAYLGAATLTSCQWIARRHAAPDRDTVNAAAGFAALWRWVPLQFST